jgi:hypothetical protein
MAADMASHAAAEQKISTGGQGAVIAVEDPDCEGSDASASNQPAEEDCDCNDSGCACPCAFTAVAFAHAVPFLARHLPAAGPAVTLQTQAVHHRASPVFRPPIG